MTRKQPTDAQIARIRHVTAARAAAIATWPTNAQLAAEEGLTVRQVQSIADGSRYRGRVPEVDLQPAPMAGDGR